jgi:hypothetical protein
MIITKYSKLDIYSFNNIFLKYIGFAYLYCSYYFHIYFYSRFFNMLSHHIKATFEGLFNHVNSTFL